MNTPDAVVLVCTNRGRHPSAQLARFVWVAASAEDDGFAVWDDESLTGTEFEPVTENTRGTKAGGTKNTRRKPVLVETRADGGRTFVIPACDRCGHPARRVQDRRIVALRRAGLRSADMSQIG